MEGGLWILRATDDFIAFNRWKKVLRATLAGDKKYGAILAVCLQTNAPPGNAASVLNMRARVFSVLIQHLDPALHYLLDDTDDYDSPALMRKLNKKFEALEPEFQAQSFDRLYNLRLVKSDPQSVSDFVFKFRTYLRHVGLTPGVTGEQYMEAQYGGERSNTTGDTSSSSNASSNSNAPTYSGSSPSSSTPHTTSTTSDSMGYPLHGAAMSRQPVQSVLANRAVLRLILRAVTPIISSHIMYEDIARLLRNPEYDEPYSNVLNRFISVSQLLQHDTDVYSASGNNFGKRTNGDEGVSAMKVQTQKPKGKYTCFGCGSKNHFRSDCPAKNSKCHNCGRTGHYKKVCKAAPNGVDRSGTKRNGSNHHRNSAHQQSRNKNNGGGVGPGNAPNVQYGSHGFSESGHVAQAQPVQVLDPRRIGDYSDGTSANFAALPTNDQRPCSSIIKEGSNYISATDSSCPLVSAMLASNSTTDDTAIIHLDSGASRHIFNKPDEYFSNPNLLAVPITGFDGSVAVSQKSGDVVVHRTDNRSVGLRLPKALKVENGCNLVSVSRICQEFDAEVTFSKDGAQVTNPEGTVILTANEHNGVYAVNGEISSAGERANSMAMHDLVDRGQLSTNPLVMLHYALGHLNYQSLRKLIRDQKIKVPSKTADLQVPTCTVCAVTTLTRRPYQKIREYNEEYVPGDCIIGDVKSVLVKSLGGNTAFFIFVDVASGYVLTYPIKSIRDTESIVEAAKHQIFIDLKRKVQVLALDAEPYFCSARFKAYVHSLGIHLVTASGGGHEEVGLAESNIRNVWWRTLRMLHHVTGNRKDVGRLWAIALQQATHLVNHLPTASLRVGSSATRAEAYFGSNYKISFDDVVPFGTPCAVLTNQPDKGVADKAKVMMMIGKAHGNTGYYVLNLDTKRVQHSRTVKPLLHRRFITNMNLRVGTDEDIPLFVTGLEGEVSEKLSRVPGIDDESDHHLPNLLHNHDNNPVRPPESTAVLSPEEAQERYITATNPTEDDMTEPWNDDPPIIQHRLGEGGAEPTTTALASIAPTKNNLLDHSVTRVIELDDTARGDYQKLLEELSCTVAASSIPQPATFDEAVQHPKYGLAWKIAIKEELDTLNKNSVIRWYVPRPENTRVISTRWVFAVQRHGDGKFRRFKARLVARGFDQKYGVHFFMSFAPTASLDAIRFAIAYATIRGWRIFHLDVKGAYHFGTFEEGIRVFIEQPPGLQLYPPEQVVCELLRPLYGTKQGGACWSLKADQDLYDLGYYSSPHEHCLYIHKDKDGNVDSMIVRETDDYLFVGCDRTLDTFMAEMKRRVDIINLGELDHYFGMTIERDIETGQTAVHQAGYIDDLFKRFDDGNVLRKNQSPFNMNLKRILDQDPDPADIVYMPRYRELVGSLLYLSICTRPDIIYPVAYLSQFVVQHTKAHWKALVGVLKYVKGTQYKKMVYRKDGGGLTAYCDSSYADDVKTRRSTNGHVLLLAGAPVVFYSARARIVCLSTCEAEYVALSPCGQTCAWIFGILKSIGDAELARCTNDKDYIPVFCDNNGARHWATNAGAGRRYSKHIDIRYKYITQLCRDRVVKVKYVPSKDNPADMFTKPVDGNLLRKYCAFINLH